MGGSLVQPIDPWLTICETLDVQDNLSYAILHKVHYIIKEQLNSNIKVELFDWPQAFIFRHASHLCDY